MCILWSAFKYGSSSILKFDDYQLTIFVNLHRIYCEICVTDDYGDIVHVSARIFKSAGNVELPSACWCVQYYIALTIVHRVRIACAHVCRVLHSITNQV